MYPGPAISTLPELTQMEEMLISPVHALVQLWQVRGGQFKYTGHTCNFPRENSVFHAKVPLLPEHCDVIIMRRTGVDIETSDAVYQDFRVRRAVVQQWLEYLESHHPTFRAREVTVDYNHLNQLPEDSSVYARLRTIEAQDIEEPAEPVGPPETETEPHVDEEQTPLFSRGFVPNLQTSSTELEQLHAAAFHNDQPIVLTMPIIRGTPISEYSGRAIAIDAFPSLFPTGQADFTATVL
jgi:hypothetical protein